MKRTHTSWAQRSPCIDAEQFRGLRGREQGAALGWVTAQEGFQPDASGSPRCLAQASLARLGYVEAPNLSSMSDREGSVDRVPELVAKTPALQQRQRRRILLARAGPAVNLWWGPPVAVPVAMVVQAASEPLSRRFAHEPLDPASHMTG